MYKYTLIVSQYYHSYHQFIVGHDKNFLEDVKNMARELIEYKRDEEREEYLGDLSYYTDGKIRSRYNINDEGDIYIINFETLESAIYHLMKYNEDGIIASNGYKRKDVMRDIYKHHDYDEIRNIINKHLNIL